MGERLQKLIEMNEVEENDFLLFAIAKEWEQEGNFIEAEKNYHRLTQLYPKYVGAYYHYASLMQQLGREQEANQWIETGLKWCMTVGDHHAAAELRALKDDN
jgi:tetratricopeptide (TPR) repeat protein